MQYTLWENINVSNVTSISRNSILTSNKFINLKIENNYEKFRNVLVFLKIYIGLIKICSSQIKFKIKYYQELSKMFEVNSNISLID